MEVSNLASSAYRADVLPLYCLFQIWNRSCRNGQDRTKSSSGWTKPDFCQFDVKNEPARFFQFDAKNESAGLQADRTNFESGRTGPDGKNPPGSNSGLFALQPKGNTSDVTSKIQVTQHVDLLALIILDSKTEV
jgi:hypothetical protein